MPRARAAAMRCSNPEPLALALPSSGHEQYKHSLTWLQRRPTPHVKNANPLQRSTTSQWIWTSVRASWVSMNPLEIRTFEAIETARHLMAEAQSGITLSQ
eukprot:CAMPEP_0198348262 /NCGR_PEP_ID=MMETSP1450-20131203/89036_1 /TAXON_ID=753684 ORGANISM="Madagascaria erythrocladiodes, Strain CCMP3234" /NCGR_SAMPLE_ID=MMETSP1450 /ASSEMBLY_ACC=CAM_ASM_001115 /LENGTH=99 /DNA_ID=CAMNT_0044053873 /DNA_START=28 /DNA_END=325 /DNA_ORIENTATION=-